MTRKQHSSSPVGSELTTYQITSLPGVNFVLHDDYQKLLGRLKALEESYGKLLEVLRKITDYEHVPEGEGCKCWAGDNGYTCGRDLAEKAIDQAEALKREGKKS